MNESLIGAQKTKYLTVLGTKEAPEECQKDTRATLKIIPTTQIQDNIMKAVKKRKAIPCNKIATNIQ